MGIDQEKSFDPATEIPSLQGKVILVTGGTAGLGSESVKAFAAHNPEHIYFTGRNATAAESLIAEIRSKHPSAALTFIKLDLSSLTSVVEGTNRGFKHDRLDILLNNAGIIAKPPSLSADGYEIQFATNHLGHAMLTKQLLPRLLNATRTPGADVRVVTTTSEGYEFHRMIKGGIAFDELKSGSTMSRKLLGPWVRYGQAKLANILFAAELGRRYPEIMSVSIHPGVVKTPMFDGLTGFNKLFNDFGMWANSITPVEPHQGAWNQLWCGAGAKRRELVSGAFYKPVGVNFTEKAAPAVRDEQLAKRLWDWTDEILARVEDGVHR
jgi:NAD(P)-dependent dehydrogenase (short-subunit alcohol dehydrogenase family)